jgi:putative membrane protein
MGFVVIGGMFLFWILLIGVAVVAIRALFQTNWSKPPNASPNPRQILERRYARGEIDRDQFQAMLKDLK